MGNHTELISITTFLELWKIAHVTAIFKRSGSKTDKRNFRPISLLPTLSKLCESVMHDRLFKHCLENDIISHKQAAYLKGDSTVSQLLYIVHNIRKNWGVGKITHGLFLDVSSAFDKVGSKDIGRKFLLSVFDPDFLKIAVTCAIFQILGKCPA